MRWYLWEPKHGCERPLRSDPDLDHWYALVAELGDRAFMALDPRPAR